MAKNYTLKYILGRLVVAAAADVTVIMAALCNRAGYYIFALWFLSIYLLFFLA